MYVKECIRQERLYTVVNKFRYYYIAMVENKLSIIVSDYPLSISTVGYLYVEEEFRKPLYQIDMSFRMTGKWNSVGKNIKRLRYSLANENDIENMNCLVRVFKIIRK